VSTDIVAAARTIAIEAHRGQVDKAGAPYIDHPRRVADAMAGNPCAEAVAWLHDVVEDTAVTLDDLARRGMPAEVVSAVDAMTRRSGETEHEYWARVRSNPVALAVKVRGDIADNADPRRLARLDPHTRQRLADKYRRALDALEG
jgi:(p)ppGpp synthase/HD superfamily hydrolase